MSSILFEIIGSVAKITFNRPDKYNSFNQEMAFAFHNRLDECASNENIRAVYITGEGKAFCAGQDLQEIVDPDGPELTDIVTKHYNPIIKKIRHLEKPVIAAINGVAAGAGSNIGLCCDVVVATESASFIQAFSKIGLIPDSAGTYFLPRLIGMQKASALMMLGDKISAKEAEALGMIYQYFPDEAFAEASMKIAQQLSRMPTRGLWLTKKLLHQTYNNNLDQQLEQEGIIQTEAGQTHDYKEGVSAFLEKRKPDFKGK